jgi:urocanate hydratase
MARHVEAMVGFQDAGAEVFDYGNSIRGEAKLAGYERVRLPRLRSPPTSGRCSARARDRSAGGAVRDPKDIAATDRDLDTPTTRRCPVDPIPG